MRRYGDMSKEELLDKKVRRKATSESGVKWLTILINIAHQGFFYLEPTEKVMRIMFELVPAFILTIVILCLPWQMNLWLIILVALTIAHLANWVLNHNFIACLMVAIPSLTNRGVDKTIDYLNALQKRVSKRRSITAIMYIGSVCRFEWGRRSDIDIRFLRAPGIANGICAYFVTFHERMLAVFAGQPFDLFLADSPEFLRHHREDECPIFSLRRDARLSDEDFPGETVPCFDHQMFVAK